MSTQTQGRAPSRGNAPWIVAGVLAVLAAVLVVLLIRTHSVGDDNKRNAGRLVAPTSDQAQAVLSASVEAQNLTTFSRKSFEQDFARALAGSTGSLRSDVESKKSLTLKAMTDGNFDLKSTVVNTAFESEADGKVLALVTLNGAGVLNGVTSPITTPQRLELTMVRSGDKWLAANLSLVTTE